jgi:hypothetical protein
LQQPARDFAFLCAGFLFLEIACDKSSIHMWQKIFLIALAIAALITVVAIYLTHSWLGSLTNPVDVAENYEFLRGWTYMILFFSSIVLFIIANAVLYSQRKAWALWTTFLFFSGFLLLQSWWSDGNFFAFKKANNLWHGETSLVALAAAIGCVVAAAVTFFDQAIVLRMRDRIHGMPHEKTAIEETADKKPSQ